MSSAAAEQMEDMMAYSVLLGRTITCMSFPGIQYTRTYEHQARSVEYKKKMAGGESTINNNTRAYARLSKALRAVVVVVAVVLLQ